MSEVPVQDATPPCPMPFTNGALLHAFSRYSTDIVALLNECGGILYRSPSAIQHLGGHANGTPDTLHLQALLHPDDAEAVNLALSALPVGLVTALPAHRARHADGSWRWLEGSATSLLHEPEIRAVLIAARDVTERVMAEQAAWEQGELARTLLESSPDCVKVLDLNGDLLSMNTHGLRLMEIQDFQAVCGANWPDFWQADGPAVRAAVQAARGGETRRFQAYCPTHAGTPKWWDVIVTPIHGMDGRPVRLLAVSRDITSAHQAQQRIQAQAQHTQRILESITEAFYAFDADWNFTYINEQAARMLHRDASELLGKNAWETFPEAVGTEVERQYRRALADQQTLHFETYYEPLHTWFENHVYPSPDGVSIFFQDITARKAAEQLDRDRSRVLEMTAQGEPLARVLSEVALLVERQLPDHRCAVMQLQDERLYTLAAPSLPEAYNASVDGYGIGPTEGSCGAAAFLREAVTVEDIATHPYWLQARALAVPYGLRACTSLPLMDGTNEVLGTLALYARTPGPLPEKAGALLEVARQLATVVLEHARMAERLAFQAQHDPLTRLPNRSFFTAQLEQSLNLTRRARQSLALLFVDLDDFKAINDTLGHLAGDAVLNEVANRLRSCTRSGDTLARLGGDEFTMILPYTGEEQAVKVAQRILTVFAQPIHVHGRELFVNPSVGVSVAPHAGLDVETLQRHADMAMYRAKSRKAGYAVFEAEMNRRTVERLQLASDLRRALELQELELHYQPQVKIQDGTLSGMEALLRWRHPRLGFVSPAQFIPIAEETGLIAPIGTWVLQEACRQGVEWTRQGHSPFVVAVNVSALQFEREDFVETVARCLRDSGLPPERLELELTESAVMHDVEESSARMKQLRALGVSISVDDFGTGYSSLAYLQRLPLNVLKIDRGFVQALTKPGGSLPVVKAIISLAQHLDLTTIAEGVETDEELAVLKQLGCDVAQGYLFSRPLPAAEVLL